MAPKLLFRTILCLAGSAYFGCLADEVCAADGTCAGRTAGEDVDHDDVANMKTSLLQVNAGHMQTLTQTKVKKGEHMSLARTLARWSMQTDFHVGDKVEAKYEIDGKWHGAEVEKVYTDGTYYVKWDDGTEGYCKEVRGLPPPTPVVGDHIMAKYEIDGKWYGAKLEKIYTDGTYYVLWDDGHEGMVKEIASHEMWGR